MARGGWRVLMALFTIVAVLLCPTYVGLVSGQAVSEVRVGVILPLSGPAAATGDFLMKGVELAVEEINSTGGIKSLGGARIRLIPADSTGKPEVGMAEAERLIKAQSVSVLLGAYQSAVTFPTTQVAERYKVPFLVISSTRDSITERGFRYTFRHTARASFIAEAQVQFLLDISKQTGQSVTVAIVNENTDQGSTNASYQKKFIREAGLKLAAHESYSPDSTDLTALVLKLMKAKPDVVLATSYIGDAILLTRTMAEMGLDAAIVASGGGHVDPHFRTNLGKLAEYVFSQQPWAPEAPMAVEFRRKYQARYGLDPDVSIAEAYSVPHVLAAALEKAGSRDTEKIRDAMADLVITEGPALTAGTPRIEFGPDGQNPHFGVCISQIRNAKYVTVWPRDRAAIAPVWPVPRWSER